MVGVQRRQSFTLEEQQTIARHFPDRQKIKKTFSRKDPEVVDREINKLERRYARNKGERVPSNKAFLAFVTSYKEKKGTTTQTGGRTAARNKRGASTLQSKTSDSSAARNKRGTSATKTSDSNAGQNKRGASSNRDRREKRRGSYTLPARQAKRAATDESRSKIADSQPTRAKETRASRAKPSERNQRVSRTTSTKGSDTASARSSAGRSRSRHSTPTKRGPGRPRSRHSISSDAKESTEVNPSIDDVKKTSTGRFAKRRRTEESSAKDDNSTEDTNNNLDITEEAFMDQLKNKLEGAAEERRLTVIHVSEPVSSDELVSRVQALRRATTNADMLGKETALANFLKSSLGVELRHEVIDGKRHWSLFCEDVMPLVCDLLPSRQLFWPSRRLQDIGGQKKNPSTPTSEPNGRKRRSKSGDSSSSDDEDEIEEVGEHTEEMSSGLVTGMSGSAAAATSANTSMGINSSGGVLEQGNGDAGSEVRDSTVRNSSDTQLTGLSE